MRRLAVLLLFSLAACQSEESSRPIKGENGNPETRTKQESIVLGREIANATEEERKRIERGVSANSPMPSEAYDRWRGDPDLFDPAPLPLDAKIRDVCRKFRNASPQERVNMRDGTSMDGFYTLLTFGQRGAVFAIRQKDASVAIAGLTATAMIDLKRIDFRNGFMSVGLLDHALNRLGEDGNQRILDASTLAEPNMAKLLVDYTRRKPEDRQLSAWGYDEFKGPQGTGFIRRGFNHFDPDTDLTSIAIEIAALIRNDKYLAEVELATTLPSFWLRGHDDAWLLQAIASIEGGATVNCALRREEHPEPFSQQMTVFLVETGSVEYASRLLGLSKLPGKGGHHMVGVATGKVFCLMVARSAVQGVDDYESAESLTRFEPELHRILDRGAATGNPRFLR